MKYKIIFLLLLAQLNVDAVANYLVGAYYYANWWQNPVPAGYLKSGVDWRAQYPQREPAIGWFDDEQCFVDQEIVLASMGGINFFAFDFYTDRPDQKPGSAANLNNGLKFYMSSENKRLINFVLVYMNTEANKITDLAEWDIYTDLWVSYFQDPQYLKINGKPVFIVNFGLPFRADWGGSSVAAKNALQIFRNKAIAAGFPDIIMGGGMPQPSSGNINDAKNNLGYNFLTAYNADYRSLPAGPNNYNALLSILPATWNLFKQYGLISYAPITVQGYDKRPLGIGTDPYLINKTPELFNQQLQLAKTFLDQNPSMWVEGQKMLMVNAWNEIGLDSMLTPLLSQGDIYLEQIEAVFS